MTSPAVTFGSAPTTEVPAIPSAVRGTIMTGAALAGLLVIGAAGRHFAVGSPTTSISTIWLPLHLMTAIPALPLGAWVLLRRKGDAMHRLLGRIWAMLMLGAALTSFGMAGALGRVGPIHLLAVAILIALPRAVLAARRGRILAHRRGMILLYASLILATLFAFLPGRMMGLWLFG
jgi:uncharacterized membrane protein